MLNSEENKNIIISAFPNLQNDPDFRITDGPNPNFNCIAWAAIVTNYWWWPLPENQRPIKALDGVIYDWPFNAPFDTKLETFMYVFSKKQYTACENGDYEEGFGKICLYGKSTNEITHASRQITFGKDKGKWTSKLGTQFTINHGTAYFIESQEYGEVIQFMKRQWP